MPPKHAPFGAELLQRPAPRVARALLGAILLDRRCAHTVAGRIVEVEAYQQNDPASHSFGGLTRRTASMFGRAGLAYVYRSYGIHWCLNIVCGAEGHGAAVLVRALQPLAGLAHMAERRGLTMQTPTLLCRGPGNLTKAMAIDHRCDGLDLLAPNATLQLLRGEPVPAIAVAKSPRIGITRAVDKLWRFYVADSSFVSAKRAKKPVTSAGLTTSLRR